MLQTRSGFLTRAASFKHLHKLLRRCVENANHLCRRRHQQREQCRTQFVAARQGGELLDPADVPEKYRDQYRAEGHKRLTWPLAPMAFAGMALAALLTGEFNRRGQWRRLLAAVVATLGFQVAQLGIASLVVKTPMLTPAMYLLPLGTFAACLAIFRDHRIRRGVAAIAPPGTAWRSGEQS